MHQHTDRSLEELQFDSTAECIRSKNQYKDDQSPAPATARLAEIGSPPPPPPQEDEDDRPEDKLKLDAQREDGEDHHEGVNQNTLTSSVKLLSFFSSSLSLVVSLALGNVVSSQQEPDEWHRATLLRTVFAEIYSVTFSY